MRQFLIAAGFALALSATTAPALAASAQDAAWDKRNQPVGDSRGNCVRTKWQDVNDPCAPEPVPVPVAAPAPAPAPAPMPIVALEQRTIYFDFDSAALTAESTAKLDQLSGIINNSLAIADVRIHGYTDQFGSSSYNEALANQRAAAVKDYLDGRSRLDANVGDIRGLGKSSPAEGCGAIKKRADRISCMAQERRVEIEFKAQVQ